MVKISSNEQDQSVVSLDALSIHRQFARVATVYDSVSLLQHEIADELIDRIDLLRSVPDLLFDLGSGTGYLGRRVKQRVPAISVIGVERVGAMASRASTLDPDARTVIAVAEKLPLASSTVPLVVSNLLLHWCDVGGVFSEVARVLGVEGAFLFSTLGPDTLIELRKSWAQVDDQPHVHTFIDMHDLGDALVAAGFSTPVLDTDRITITYENVEQLLSELRSVGANNARLDRRRTWTGKERFRQFLESYKSLAEQSRIPSTWEIIYGMAFKDQRVEDFGIPVTMSSGLDEKS